MPKILPNVSSAGASVGADSIFLTSQSRAGVAQSRSKPDGSPSDFEKALDGARRRERPKADREDDDNKLAETEKASKHKSKHRTERKAKDKDAKSAQAVDEHTDEDESTDPTDEAGKGGEARGEIAANDPKVSNKDGRAKHPKATDADAAADANASQAATTQTAVAGSKEQDADCDEAADASDDDASLAIEKPDQPKSDDDDNTDPDAATALAAATAGQTKDADKTPSQQSTAETASRAANPAAQAAKHVRPVGRSLVATDGDDQPQLGRGVAAKPDKAIPTSANRAGVIESLDSGADVQAAGAAKDSPHEVHAGESNDPAASFAHLLETLAPRDEAKAPATTGTTQSLPAQSAPAAPEVQFADDNHPAIVAGVRGQLMPNGGTMRLRLDPPELGPLAVTVRMRNGTMEASFETSNDEAAKLLSHSLSSLKSSLESQGMNVERLHVQQAPKGEQSNNGGNNGNDRDGQPGHHRDGTADHPAHREQQRREMLRRMWRKLSGVDDPLDMVA